MLQTRRQKLAYIKQFLKAESLSQGLEISPSINPMCTPADGFSIEYLDALSTQELQERALSKGRDPGDAPVIDHLLDFQRPISDCVGGKHYDFVLSSHVVEHIPNLIDHFQQVERLLRPGGSYSFLVPDKDLCFDANKPDTSLGALVEAFVSRHSHAPISALIDEYFYAVQREGKGAWGVHASEPFHDKYQDKRHLINKLISSPRAVEKWHGHIWRFSPGTFKSLYQEMYHLGLVGLELQEVIPTPVMEFIVILRRR
jgi:SAM-dependent methyltransferase